MLHEDRPVDADRHAQHTAAGPRSLGWADEAARVGEYDDALKWLDVVEAVGTDLSADYRAKRDEWRQAARPPRAAPRLGV